MMVSGIYRHAMTMAISGAVPARLLLCCLIIMLASCGFQLRGSYQLPEVMQTTYLETPNENSELVRALRRSLQSNVKLVSSRQQAQASLRLFNEQHNKRILSVDTRGRAREYEINYKISFELTVAGDDKVYEIQHLSLQRDFAFDVEDVLATDREPATLLSDMQQDMVRLIMLRLQALEK